ncbi:MAG: flagellar basal body rod protein FlgB [Clostridiales bacterium]|nr:flagellar basal body rod protein FlgB [Clostridiales bacterium]
MWNDLFSPVNLIEQGINASWLKNEVIGNNIANVDTPGFKKSRVEFERVLAAALDGGSGPVQLKISDERHMAGRAGTSGQVEPRIVTEQSTSARLDGNNVDIETEMAELAKNSIAYYALVSKLNAEFRKLDDAIHVT